MLPGIVALIEALFYAWRIPVNLAVRLEGPRVGAGVSAFVRWRARRRAAADLSEKGGRKKPGPEPGQVWAVLRRLKFQRLALSGRVSLGDAAATAMLCGALGGLACALGGRTEALRVDVRPDFSQDFRLELQGMLTARAGQIILAIIFMKGRERHGQASH